MADSKLTALTAKTSPALTDIVYIVESPSGTPASKKITVQELRSGYVLIAQAGPFNPADATTYMVGMGYGAAPISADGAQAVVIPRAGTVTAIGLHMRNLTANGTTETSTISFRLNSSSDTTISSTLNLSGDVHLTTTGLSIAVAANDSFEVKWVTPTWVTNPQGVVVHATVYIS